MTRIDSTKVKWRVQVRKSRAHKWQNKGLFETRRAARDEAWLLRFQRAFLHTTLSLDRAHGFGNTRAIPEGSAMSGAKPRPSRSLIALTTQQELKSLLAYDPETGVFTWLANLRGGRAKVGKTAGYLANDGYLSISIRQRSYQAHRLAWLYMTGEWPREFIDHLNGNRSDNRIANLREATRAVNAQNKQGAARSNKASGLLGISRASTNRWKAKIVVDGKALVLGYFVTPEEAHEAYLAGKRQLHPGNTL